MALYKRSDSPEHKQKKRQEYIDEKRAEAIDKLPPERRPGFQDRLSKARKRQRQK